MADENLIQVNRPDGYGQTKEGLLVPSELARQREVWFKEEVKLMRRLAKMLDHHQVNALLVCRDCGEVIVPDDESGEVEFVCKCKRRVVL
jgi:hypothetical protein